MIKYSFDQPGRFLFGKFQEEACYWLRPCPIPNWISKELHLCGCEPIKQTNNCESVKFNDRSNGCAGLRLTVYKQSYVEDTTELQLREFTGR